MHLTEEPIFLGKSAKSHIRLPLQVERTGLLTGAMTWNYLFFIRTLMLEHLADIITLLHYVYSIRGILHPAAGQIIIVDMTFACRGHRSLNAIFDLLLIYIPPNNLRVARLALSLVEHLHADPLNDRVQIGVEEQVLRSELNHVESTVHANNCSIVKQYRNIGHILREGWIVRCSERIDIC